MYKKLNSCVLILAVALGLTTLILSACSASKNTSSLYSDQLVQLDWLTGRWQRSDINEAGQSGLEVWERLSDHSLRGYGLLLHDADTLFHEKLRIVARDSNLYYVADVAHNAAPVSFRITELNAHSFRSENPDHDFPKVITYLLESEGELRVEVSAGEKKQRFVFKKLD